MTLAGLLVDVHSTRVCDGGDYRLNILNGYMSGGLIINITSLFCFLGNSRKAFLGKNDRLPTFARLAFTKT